MPNALRRLAGSLMDKKRLYIITTATLKPVKVGIAEKPSVRLVTLQTSTWVELGIYATFVCPNAQLFEAKVMALLKRHNIRGEWFDIDAPVVVETILAVFAMHSEGINLTVPKWSHSPSRSNGSLKPRAVKLPRRSTRQQRERERNQRLSSLYPPLPLKPLKFVPRP